MHHWRNSGARSRVAVTAGHDDHAETIEQPAPPPGAQAFATLRLLLLREPDGAQGTASAADIGVLLRERSQRARRTDSSELA